ncbi:type I-E CRISPR-associated protein Cas6/Cse3/CasE [Rhodovibrio sodomensis]|uniref:Type I-E CRISPR-associated protein Cas6/Cse3/CasE n=1 Tax=Rhodovibrio sodomensis TaxID=1088 RepID=A0ABS1DGB9_9PROT|nr:type I-E CRISPR-associated protein Cas6/Cse3/CasE [Rhodovibrio sodomensis]MBK1669505.1 type I-E CRISPR-associated protein Cas6/Cse3/CasE [Rhodovibrio sodomensis]
MTYMIRARLRRDAVGSDGALVKLVADNALAPGKRHDLVWTLFSDGPERDRDFVFRMDEDAGRPVVTAYAPRPPTEDARRLWEVWHKPFVPKLYPGDRLRFSLRVNPVKQAGNARIDAVYDAFDARRKAAEAAGETVPDRLEIARDVGCAWLDRRASALGLEFDAQALEAEAYRTETIRKPGGKRFTLSLLDLTGLAEVTDPQRLIEALPAGIGKGKAYGCGLMLMARA